MIGALSITLLIGCTSNSNETKASNKEASTTVKEKEIVYENVMFEQKVRKLEISSVNSKGSNKIVNKTNMKTILQVWKAQRKNTPSRSRCKKHMHSK